MTEFNVGDLFEWKHSDGIATLKVTEVRGDYLKGLYLDNPPSFKQVGETGNFYTDDDIQRIVVAQSPVKYVLRGNDDKDVVAFDTLAEARAAQLIYGRYVSWTNRLVKRTTAIKDEFID